MAKNKGPVVAREACVIVVGARPVEYAKITVRHNKTGELVEIDNQNDVIDEGDSGVPYAFKAFQKVNANHPAVLDSPDSFMPLSDVEEGDLDAVVTA